MLFLVASDCNSPLSVGCRTEREELQHASRVGKLEAVRRLLKIDECDAFRSMGVRVCGLATALRLSHCIACLRPAECRLAPTLANALPEVDDSARVAS